MAQKKASPDKPVSAGSGKTKTHLEAEISASVLSLRPSIRRSYEDKEPADEFEHAASNAFIMSRTKDHETEDEGLNEIESLYDGSIIIIIGPYSFMVRTDRRSPAIYILE